MAGAGAEAEDEPEAEPEAGAGAGGVVIFHQVFHTSEIVSSPEGVLIKSNAYMAVALTASGTVGVMVVSETGLHKSSFISSNFTTPRSSVYISPGIHTAARPA